MCDNSDSSEDEDILKNYAIVQFIKKGNNKIKCVDIVPAHWLDWDPIKKRSITKFINKIKSKSDFQNLRNRVEKLADAPEEWPYFPVRIKGKAGKVFYFV